MKRYRRRSKNFKKEQIKIQISTPKKAKLLSKIVLSSLKNQKF